MASVVAVQGLALALVCALMWGRGEQGPQASFELGTCVLALLHGGTKAQAMSLSAVRQGVSQVFAVILVHCWCAQSQSITAQHQLLGGPVRSMESNAGSSQALLGPRGWSGHEVASSLRPH